MNATAIMGVTKVVSEGSTSFHDRCSATQNLFEHFFRMLFVEDGPLRRLPATPKRGRDALR